MNTILKNGISKLPNLVVYRIGWYHGMLGLIAATICGPRLWASANASDARAGHDNLPY